MRLELDRRAELEQKRSATETGAAEARAVRAEQQAAELHLQLEQVRQALEEREAQLQTLESERSRLQQLLGTPNWRRLLAQVRDGSASVRGAWRFTSLSPTRDTAVA